MANFLPPLLDSKWLSLLPRVRNDEELLDWDKFSGMESRLLPVLLRRLDDVLLDDNDGGAEAADLLDRTEEEDLCERADFEERWEV